MENGSSPSLIQLKCISYTYCSWVNILFLPNYSCLLHKIWYNLCRKEQSLMRKFDYSFLENQVSARLLNLIAIIYDIKGKESVRLKDSPKLFNQLKEKAIRDSIKGSNAIENIHTTEKRIDEIAAGDNKSFTHTEKEIIGYRNVLNDIHTYNERIIFDKTTILSLHNQLLDVAKSDNRGHFKKEPNIISEKRNGKNCVVFVPTAPKDVEESIDQMLIAYNEASHNPNINPILLIACFILDFLCVHPFDDGNGRMSRLLTILLLYKSGFDIGKFISIENMINENKGEYYRTLQESSIEWQSNKNNYEPFMLYMIQILYECYLKLDENVFSQIDKKMPKSKRIEMLLLNAFVPISKKGIQDQLPDISEHLIEMVLSKLLKEEKIIKIGTFKDAVYYRK